MNTKLHEQMKARYADFRDKRRAFDPGARAWFDIAQKADDTTEVFIYDGIGMFGVDALEFVQQFAQIKTPRVNLRINSPGGDVFDGMAIYNAIKSHGATVTSTIDGVAASMASIIALAGDTVEMHESSLFMIHEPWSMVLGNADDMRAEADLLDKIAGQGVEIYKRAARLSETEILTAMAAETWYTANEAMEVGFAHSVIPNKGDDGPNEKLLFDLSVFANAPTQFQRNPDDTRDAMPDRRTVEIALRDAGCSRREAKAIVSRGFTTDENARDARVDVLSHNLNDFLSRIKK